MVDSKVILISKLSRHRVLHRVLIKYKKRKGTSTVGKLCGCHLNQQIKLKSPLMTSPSNVIHGERHISYVVFLLKMINKNLFMRKQSNECKYTDIPQNNYSELLKSPMSRWAFSAAVETPLGTPTSHFRMPVFKS